MRYHYSKDTVYIKGEFRAASTGVAGGLKCVSTLLNHTVPKDFDHEDPAGYIRGLVAAKGYGEDTFGLLTAVWMQNLCVMRYDYVTAFVTAGVTNPSPDPMKPHTINIIVTSDEGMTDACLLETIRVTTEAKAHALRLLGREFTGTTSDAVITACSGGVKHIYAGTFTELGRRVYDAVLHGVLASLDRHEGRVVRSGPSFFIYSRFEGDHWVEWQKEGCPYYPCHFPGQACDFCYCPFYPCHDTELGEMVEGSSGGQVWACTDCTLLHLPHVAAYLKAHPDATLDELKALRNL